MVPEDTRDKLLIGLSAPGQLDLSIPAVQAHDSTSPLNFHPPVVARMCHEQLLSSSAENQWHGLFRLR